MAQGGEGVGGLHRSGDVGERCGTRTRPSKGGPCWCELQEGTMPSALTLEDMSPGLLKVVERAKDEPEGRFHSLAHLVDVPALTRAYRRARSDAAVGVDGVTKEHYGHNLEANLQALHARLKTKRYRHQPIRRVYIPKGQGKKCDRLGLRRLRISWFKTPCVRCWKRSTSRTFWAARMDFGPGAVPMTPYGPSTR